MKELVNINPELNAFILGKAGLNFDGYYYTNPEVPFQLHKEEEGYIPTFKDPGLPSLDVALKTYSELIVFMYQALQFTMQLDIQQGKLQPTPESISIFVKKWWSFDPDLKFGLVFDGGAVGIVPNDEYTYSMANGGIHDFEVHYSIGDNDSCYDITIQVTPQCISYPFLVNYISEHGSEENIPVENIHVLNVHVIDGDTKLPFFGMGIPKLSQNKNK